MRVISKIFSFLLSILLLPYYLVKMFIRGFSVLSLFLSRGFYFYIEKFFEILYKLIPVSFLQKIQGFFQRKQEQPGHLILMIMWALTAVFAYNSFFDNQNVLVEKLPDVSMVPEMREESSPKENDNYYLSMDFNLFQYYGKYSVSDISFPALLEKNTDVVSWLIVEGTNINYPIVQTNNNDYYLAHSFDKSYTSNGWPFMDYRNKSSMEDYNTIFYGHNLLNGTSFGSLKNLFENHSSHRILILTSEHVYTYEIFSVYEIDPEVYYLQTNFHDSYLYKEYLDTIHSRSKWDYPVEVGTSDKIITLSTCTDDNKGRKVVHAKLIASE